MPKNTPQKQARCLPSKGFYVMLGLTLYFLEDLKKFRNRAFPLVYFTIS